MIDTDENDPTEVIIAKVIIVMTKATKKHLIIAVKIKPKNPNRSQLGIYGI